MNILAILSAEWIGALVSILLTVITYLVLAAFHAGKHKEKFENLSRRIDEIDQQSDSYREKTKNEIKDVEDKNIELIHSWSEKNDLDHRTITGLIQGLTTEISNLAQRFQYMAGKLDNHIENGTQQPKRREIR